MKILITGAAGFIGSHLSDTFADEHDVWPFDNFLTGRRENGLCTYLDITDRPALYALANKVEPEVVIHCAASYSDPSKWHRDTDTNISGGINAALVAKHHGAHLIYFQTILPPISSYAISKIASEQYQRLAGVDLTVLRLANIYGPRNLSGPIPVFYKRLTEDQPVTVVDTARDMLYIDDLVTAVRKVVGEKLTGTYDVCSGTQRRIMELFECVQDQLGTDITPPLMPPDPDDVQGIVHPDNGVPGWTPRMRLHEGIERTIDSYRETGVAETHTHLKIGSSD